MPQVWPGSINGPGRLTDRQVPAHAATHIQYRFNNSLIILSPSIIKFIINFLSEK